MMPVFATPQFTVRIARFNSQVSVFWLDPNDDYELEAASTLTTADWETVTTGITTNETTKVYVVSPGGAQFFRLRKK